MVIAPQWARILNRALFGVVVAVAWYQVSILAKIYEFEPSPLSDPDLAKAQTVLVGETPTRLQQAQIRMLAMDRRVLHADAEMWRSLLKREAFSHSAHAVSLSLLFLLLVFENRIGRKRARSRASGATPVARTAESPAEAPGSPSRDRRPDGRS